MSAAPATAAAPAVSAAPAAAAALATAADEAAADVIVRVTGDCPLIDPEVVDALVRFSAERDLGYAGLGGEFPHGLDCEVFLHSALVQADRLATEPYEREHVTPYMKRRPQQFSTQPFEPIRGLLRERWTLDYEEDLLLLRGVVASLGKSVVTAGYRDIYAALEANPSLRRLNAHRVEKRSRLLPEIASLVGNRHKKIVVLGCDWMTSDIIRSFRDAEVNVVGVDRDPTTRENVDTFINSTLSLGGDFDMLTRQQSSSEHPAVLALEGVEFDDVVTDKEVALPLAFALKPEAYRPFIEHSLLDKAHQYRLMRDSGLPVPPFYTADEFELSHPSLSAGGGWIVKRRFGSGSRGVRVFADLPSRGVIESDDLVQQYVTGNLVGLVMNADHGSCEILGAIESIDGNTNHRFRGRNEEALPTHVRIAALTTWEAIESFTGILSVEFIVSNDDVWFVEVSPTVPSRLTRLMLGITLEQGPDGRVRATVPSRQPPAVFGGWVFADRASEGLIEGLRGEVAGVEFHHAGSGRTTVYSDGTPRALGAVIVRNGDPLEVGHMVRNFLDTARVHTNRGESLRIRL